MIGRIKKSREELERLVKPGKQDSSFNFKLKKEIGGGSLHKESIFEQNLKEVRPWAYLSIDVWIWCLQSLELEDACSGCIWRGGW